VNRRYLRLADLIVWGARPSRALVKASRFHELLIEDSFAKTPKVRAGPASARDGRAPRNSIPAV
jgi:hypothetical protein